MSLFIERGRQNLRQLEEIRAGNKSLFNAAIDLLSDHGIPYRESILSKYQVINHTVNSVAPAVMVIISAGANLDKAKSVYLSVDGQEPVRIRKRGRKGQESFKGVYYTDSGIEMNFMSVPTASLRLISDYNSVISLLREELSSKQ